MPIIRGVEAPLVFVVHPERAGQDLRRVPRPGRRQNKGKLSYSSYQPGTPSHFLGYQLNEKFDLDLTHVPYRGSGLQANGAARRPFAVRLRAGQLDDCRKHQIGKLRRSRNDRPDARPLMPDVPTFAELGYPEFTARVWFGLLVKKGTPPDVAEAATPTPPRPRMPIPTCGQKLEAQGFDVVAETGPQLLPNIKEQIVRWGKLVKASGFSAEDRGSTR